MNQMKRFKGKVALITSGTGIGRATALCFAQEGAMVAVVDINPANGRDTCRQIKELGCRALFILADVTRTVDAERIVAETVQEFGRLDILFAVSEKGGGGTVVDIYNIDQTTSQYENKYKDGNKVLIELVQKILEEFNYVQRSRAKGGLVFHAALVELEGRSVLLAASSGTGKTTCCRRLPDYWKALCDEKVLVILDGQNKYWAHPFPIWTDPTLERSVNKWNIQCSVPLFGVFFLEQSQTDAVVSIGQGESSVLIAESANRIYVCNHYLGEMDKESQRESMREVFDNACRMAKMIPAFHLHVSLNGRFWEKIEEALGW